MENTALTLVLLKLVDEESTLFVLHAERMSGECQNI